MGFQRSTLKLVFADEFEGLEIRAKRFSVGELLDVYEWSEVLRSWTGTKDELKERLGALYQLLADKVLDWNYEDEQGLPQPVDAKTFAGMDTPFLLAVLGGITRGSKQVAGPLGTPSQDGDPSLEASIPMEPLSESPPS